MISTQQGEPSGVIFGAVSADIIRCA